MVRPVEERREAIKKDSGDPTTTVLARGDRYQIYHESHNCRYIRKKLHQYREIDRAEAQHAGYAPCRQCVTAVENDVNEVDQNHIVSQIRQAVRAAESEGDDPEDAAWRVVADRNTDS